MNIDQPSDTYKKLYYEIIDELFAQICQSNINYCIKDKENDMPMPIAIWNKYEEYKANALKNMSGARLDRHKLAFCMCGAIIEIKPLCGFNGAVIVKRANELLALYVGLNMIKAYMIYDFCNKLNIQLQEKQQVNHYIKEHFDMQFPQNICDTQKYKDNFANALYWSHQNCSYKRAECFNYDIWAYAKLFYHLELYNFCYLEQAYQSYLNLHHNR